MLIQQSTAITIKFGPFLDSIDGNTAEAALTIQKADVRLSKNGGNMAAASADQGVADAGAPYDELGFYDVSLDATDTNTLGRLQVMAHEAGALSVWQDFMVVPANAYGSLVAGTDNLEVDAVAISGDSAAADNLELDYDGTGYAKANSTVGTATAVTNQVTADVTAISGDAAAANNAESFFDGTGYAGTNNVIPTVTTVGTTTTNTDMVGTDNAALAATALTDATWTDAKAGFLDAAISTRTKPADTQARVTLVDTTTTNTDMAGTDNAALAATALSTATWTGARAGYLDNLNIAEDVAGTSEISALNDLSAAQVNAEVVDALATDTYAEPGQEAPTATTSLSDKIGYLYKAFRNKLTQTAVTLSIYNDAGAVVDQKATVSDDGATFTRGEIGTGP